jgi:hypothetical protein
MTPQQQNLAALGKPQPRFDFDMASYSLAKSYANRMSENIAAYPYIPWDTTPPGQPTQTCHGNRKAFWSVASYSASHHSPA